MDEFFAAVEKLDHPELRGKPLLIGGAAEARGVVATASYEARPFGCHSAMPMAQAMRLCPQAIIIHPRHGRYGEVSDEVFDILRSFTPLVEPLSMDEAFMDVTASRRLYGDGIEIARQIKQRIAGEVGLTASVGVAPNKFLAKVASDLRKPDGLVAIDESNVHQTLDPLPVRKLWGVGPRTEEQFRRLGIRTVGQLRAAPPATLAMVFGEWAEHYQDLANGRDERPVESESQAKSIGQEETFAHDVGDLDALRDVLLRQVEQVARRLRRRELTARTVTLKLRYGDFTTLTRSATLAEPTNQTEQLWQAADGLLAAWARSSLAPLRLIGVAATNFAAAGGRQLSLFTPASHTRQRRLDAAVDEINEKFGRRAVHRGPPLGQDE
jgi:DNA polymerase-4